MADTPTLIVDVARLIDDAVDAMTPDHIPRLDLARHACDVVDEQPDADPIRWLFAWIDRALARIGH